MDLDFKTGIKAIIIVSTSLFIYGAMIGGFGEIGLTIAGILSVIIIIGIFYKALK